ncbi:dTDP-glucose 4,6-dehydratase [candidate division WOR-3 bacterium]|nr:dTDP-glucose 4,6-dehydratase [candidate division WOR-3 bacterium]
MSLKKVENYKNCLQTILVTGGAGFIGSNFIRHELENYDDVIIINLDKLTYAGNLESLKDVEKKYGISSGNYEPGTTNQEPRYFFVKGDICDRNIVDSLLSGKYWKGGRLKTKNQNLSPNIVVNFAAESHVDRSILDAEPFIDTNIKGTQVLLEAARSSWQNLKPKTQDPRPKVFIHISTDEVYGSLGKKGKFTESYPLSPNSPYSASKAAADLICRSYYNAYSFPVIITRSSNNYGPYQFPEKLIPLMIKNALEGKTLPVYGRGMNIREWLHVEDNCRAIDLVLRKGKPGETYNIGGENEMENRKVVKLICRILHTNPKTQNLRLKTEHIADPRGKAHDFRYSLDCSKIKKDLNWKPTISFEEGLRVTIDWYLSNQNWVKKVVTGEYQKYYKKIYK